ncbi:hypothetical protein Ahy_A03g016297 isoform A [Arachis hypogaea]|uniref:Uncharacterized protein n=1 Tax=Arachis hypogaea TaxID=3818 RepID=A0A445E2U2_ARAHY|nr:hypothetical protein Ahy_A03g016297 isoform A [Arachis hypogaea]
MFGEKVKLFLIPISSLNQPSFQDSLNQADKEFGYDYSTGSLTILCGQNVLDISSPFC